MKCSCGKNNPEDHLFCGYCGHPLPIDQAKAGSEAQEAAVLAAGIENLKFKLEKIENDAGNRIKENAVSWAKNLMKIYGAALGILLVALGLFGIKQFSDLEKFFDGIEEKYAERFKDLDRQISDLKDLLSEQKTNLSALSSEVNAEKERLDKLKSEAEKLDYTAEIQNLKDTVTTNMKEVTQLSDQLGQGLGKIRILENNYTKIDNKFFDINVQFDAGSGHSTHSLTTILRPLAERGFIIKNTNILRLNVDKSEVIYYSFEARPKAILIADILKSDFPTISHRLLSRRERNPMEIQIKLAKH